MEAIVWSDYLCPWCYVGQARSRQMADLGLAVVHRPYELHPSIPPEGRRVRAEGGLSATFARVAEACEEVGMAFRAPTRTPNTRRALETAEWVRLHHPEAFPVLHAALFDAHFAQGAPLDDPAVLDALVDDAGAPAAEVRAAVDEGRGRPLVDASMDQAREAGVASVPTWVLPGGFALPGALDPATVERWVTRLLARARSADDGTVAAEG
ncbi:MAG: DsbA family protein [Acidimicrobiales bacterium]|nr:DsbA family protein [Acidimicrobiales bacterium]